MRTLAKTIKKNLFTFLGKVPVSVAVSHYNAAFINGNREVAWKVE